MFCPLLHFDGCAVAQCLTRDQGAAGSSLTDITALCPWAGSTQEDLSLHNWKIVDGMLRINQTKQKLRFELKLLTSEVQLWTLKQVSMTRNSQNDVCSIWAATCDYQQCGILTSVDSDESVQPPFKFRNSKWCSVSSLTVIEYSSD